MLALGSWLLLSVASVSPTPAAAHAEKLASTYEEAACDASDGGECAPSTIEPSLSAPTLPSILDCNDARLSVWMQEMIGSCDMPRPPLPNAHVATLRTGNGQSASRISDGLTRQSPPMRSAPRASDETPPLVGSLRLTTPPIPSAPTLPIDFAAPANPPGSRLERPPRA